MYVDVSEQESLGNKSQTKCVCEYNRFRYFLTKGVRNEAIWRKGPGLGPGQKYSFLLYWSIYLDAKITGIPEIDGFSPE